MRDAESAATCAAAGRHVKRSGRKKSAKTSAEHPSLVDEPSAGSASRDQSSLTQGPAASMLACESVLARELHEGDFENVSSSNYMGARPGIVVNSLHWTPSAASIPSVHASAPDRAEQQASSLPGRADKQASSVPARVEQQQDWDEQQKNSWIIWGSSSGNAPIFDFDMGNSADGARDSGESEAPLSPVKLNSSPSKLMVVEGR